MKLNHFGLITLFLLYITQIYAGCFSQAPTGFSASQFYSQPTNVTIHSCDLSNENACCTVDLSDLISSYTDNWTQHFLNFFSYTSTTCKGALQGISCLLCSDQQSSFVQFHSIYAQVHLCSEYCSTVFNACGNSRHNGLLIQDQYAGDPVSFCYDLFGELAEQNVQLVLDQSEDMSSCWDDLPACTSESYYSEYTQCVNGHRSLVYQKKPEELCNGGVSLPATVTGLPCALSCPPGQFQSNFGCTPCGFGHYSLGSAIREDSWQNWNDLEIPFSTYCTENLNNKETTITNVPCGWTLGGFEINSGSLNNSQSAYLETSVVLIDNGTLAFNYIVDAEPRYDGLTVYVDREIVLPKTSSVFEYTLMTIPLSAGYHFIQFVYSKDQSVSSGADRAALNLVQLTPVNYAADECTPCRAGRFQNATGKSFCYDCPSNTFSTEGAYRCVKCPPNYYSFEGSPSCTQQETCTENDSHYLYDKCYYQNSQLLQNQYPVWNSPHICYDGGNVNPPYPNITEECVDCNPGQYRVGTTCEYCQDGKASTDGQSCQTCPSGTAAIKALYFENFDFWEDGLSTNCSYFCGTPGWELHDTYIDSGSGHGRYVNSNLFLTATLPSNGFVYFSYEFNCTQDCTLDFQFTNGSGGSYRGGPSSFNTGAIAVRFAVFAGTVDFRWTFTKSDPNELGRLDNVRLYYIAVSNSDVGGAINCTSCPAGTHASAAGSIVCTDCPPGTYSSEGSSSCTPCADGFFNPSYRQSSCLACGEGTSSNDNHTDCIVTCQYQLDDRQYDLLPMAKTDDEMYGPIYDSKNQKYFVNLCTKEHNNHTCIDEDGEPIDTFACQVTIAGFGVDLGDIFGYLPLRHSEFYENGGITVHLTHGENCKNGSGGFFPRQTYIDVVCDPTAGIGEPVPFDNTTGLIETSKCVYELVWKSLYGCPICSEEDYTYIISACDNQQKRYIQYVWRNNPKTCHGGVSLPETQELSCANLDSLSCPPGSYLDLSLTQPNCTLADPGFYTIGGGMMYDDWTLMPESFSSVGWIQSLGGIRSGNEETTLLYLRDFVETGSIEVTYRVFGYGDVTGGFSILLDDNTILEQVTSTNGVFTTFSFDNIQAGHRFFQFRFVGGEYRTNKGGGVGVEISKVKIYGISYAAEYQLPCPAGTYSPSAGSIECYVCPRNFYSDEGSSECTECEDGSYSNLGSSECTAKEPCTLENYQVTYLDCSDNQRNTYYVELEPFNCDDSEFTQPQIETVPCDQFDCEPGQYRYQSSECKSCPDGYYWNSEDNECARSQPGYAGILQIGWYNQPETQIPSHFSTGCTGDCFTVEYSGWRSRSTFLDSGDNSGRHVDVHLDLTLELLYDGSIEFLYSVDADNSNGIYFIVNDVQQNIEYNPSSSVVVTTPLESGQNAIRWVYHQEENSTGSVSLSNIIITGAGSSVQQTACPKGSFSSEIGSNTCTPCPAGSFSSDDASTACTTCSDHTFSEFEGSDSCLACGSLTHSNSNHTDCESTCVFYVNDGELEVDLTPLMGDNGPFTLSSSTNKLWLNICQKKSSSVVCVDPITGDPINTYSCQIDNIGRGVDSGRLLSSTVNEDGSIRMHYTNGDLSSCNNPVTTDLLFICDPDIDNSEPVESDDSNSCDLKLTWRISYACPVCDPVKDYVEKRSDCVDSSQTVAYVRNSTCFGPKVVNSREESCTTPINIPIILVLVVIVVIIILIIVVIAIVVWNRKLQQQYSALVQKSSGSYEMSEIPESATEEDA